MFLSIDSLKGRLLFSAWLIKMPLVWVTEGYARPVLNLSWRLLSILKLECMVAVSMFLSFGNQFLHNLVRIGEKRTKSKNFFDCQSLTSLLTDHTIRPTSCHILKIDRMLAKYIQVMFQNLKINISQGLSYRTLGALLVTLEPCLYPMYANVTLCHELV